MGPIRISQLRPVGLTALAVLAFCLATGCSRSKKWELEPIRSAQFAPQPPPVLTSPVSTLLTNSGDFSARTRIVGWPSVADPDVVGQLFGHGSMLVFVADPKSQDDDEPKEKVDPGFSFLWNVTENKGYLLSEALQGYAPVSAARSFGTLTSAPGSDTSAGETFVETLDGSTNTLQVWRDAAPVKLPTRAVYKTGNQTISVSLSRVRLERIAPELFRIPEGFTAFPSAEALVDELAMRQRQLHRRDPALDLPLATP